MSLSQSLLPEFDNEMSNTRRLLERVPEDRMAWQPHAKSMSLARLATHLAELPGWGANVLRQEDLDLARARDAGYKPATVTARADILELFDTNVRDIRALIEEADDAALTAPWALRRGDMVLFKQPRIAALRNMLLSHMIHHRGQLTVYLRLNDVPLPPIYGPTADEAF
jgi:uncharacterized damage-inducible protein DinB